MKERVLSLDKQKILTVIIGSAIGVILVVVLINGYVFLKLHKLENKVEEQQKILNSTVVEKVTEVIHNPMHMAGENIGIEAETLTSMEEFLSSEQVKNLKAAIIKEVEAHVTQDVYLGLHELMYEELNAAINKAVEDITSDSLSEEQIDIISSAIQDKVLEEITESIEKISKEMYSDNKLIKSLEEKITSIGGRMDVLESTLEESVLELKKKDKELENAINVLRLSFVEGSIGTSDLQMLSVQMATNRNILSECENALQNNLTNCTETEVESYLGTINVYREQIDSVEAVIVKAFDEGGTSAGDELTASAADLSKRIVEFGSVIEESKISLDNVKTQLQGQINELEQNVDQLEYSTTNNASQITSLNQAKTSLEAADNSLFAISRNLQAADVETENNLSGLKTDVNSLESEVDTKASQSELQSTTETISHNLQETKQEINDTLNEATDSINNSLGKKVDKSELENVMKAEVSTDENGKTTITINIVEMEE